MNRIEISVEDMTVVADLRDTPTAQLILELLPFEGRVNTWGDEIYFEIPLQVQLEPDARANVEIGDLGYWPTGSAFCIFFGPTPMSSDTKPVAASAVNIFGHINNDCSNLKNVSRGVPISIARK